MPVTRAARTALIHTRAGTGGRAADNNNNHPIYVRETPELFSTGIVGIHNGILDNHRAIWAREKELDKARVGQVDSELIFQLLAHQGVDGLDRLAGDAAIAWLTTDQPGHIQMAKLGGRPLVIAETAGGSMIYASEKRCIKEAVAHFRQLKLVDCYDVKDGEGFTYHNGELIDVSDSYPVISLAKSYSYNVGKKPTTAVAKPRGGYSLLDEEYDDWWARNAEANSRYTKAPFTDGQKATVETSLAAVNEVTEETPIGQIVEEWERDVFEVFFGEFIESSDEAMADAIELLYQYGHEEVVERVLREMGAFTDTEPTQPPLPELAAIDPVADGMPDWEKGVNHANSY